MTQKTKAQLVTAITSSFPDNSLKQITPLTMRGFFTDLMDSLMNFSDGNGIADRVTALETRFSASTYLAPIPADLTTNYNTVTTLLGVLTSAVNTSNDKINKLATRMTAHENLFIAKGLMAAS